MKIGISFGIVMGLVALSQARPKANMVGGIATANTAIDAAQNTASNGQIIAQGAALDHGKKMGSHVPGGGPGTAAPATSGGSSAKAATPAPAVSAGSSAQAQGPASGNAVQAQASSTGGVGNAGQSSAMATGVSTAGQSQAMATGVGTAVQ